MTNLESYAAESPPFFPDADGPSPALPGQTGAASEGFRRVTEIILRQLEAGVVAWRKPWDARAEPPRPLGRRRPYGGFNRMLLRSAGFACPMWITVERAGRRGWPARSGETPWPILTYVPDPRPFTFSPRPRLKLQEVYNLLQLEGPRWRPPPPTTKRPVHTIIEAAERLVAGLSDAPTIREGFSGAFYRPGADLIGMPMRRAFHSEEEYYSTLFHELVHSTGHSSRLDRWSGRQVLDTSLERYSFEELVAEIGCQFLCAETGIQSATLANSAAYLAGWSRRLGQHQSWIVLAAPQAERAARLLMGDRDGRENKGPAAPEEEARRP